MVNTHRRYIENKILPMEVLSEFLERIRHGHKIVTTNGAFDLLHKGHLHTLEEAKSYGDYLIVGLNSDSSIKGYKSPHRPIIPESQRAYMLASLSVVDYVTIFHEIDPIKFIEAMKPDFHVKSRTGFKGLETNVVHKTGSLVLIDDLEGYSSTDIINRAVRSHEASLQSYYRRQV